MILRGYPPGGVEAMSYINKPSGGVVGRKTVVGKIRRIAGQPAAPVKIVVWPDLNASFPYVFPFTLRD